MDHVSLKDIEPLYHKKFTHVTAVLPLEVWVQSDEDHPEEPPVILIQGEGNSSDDEAFIPDCPIASGKNSLEAIAEALGIPYDAKVWAFHEDSDVQQLEKIEGKTMTEELQRFSPCCQAPIEPGRGDGVMLRNCEKCGEPVMRKNPRTGQEEWLDGESPWTTKDLRVAVPIKDAERAVVSTVSLLVGEAGLPLELVERNEIKDAVEWLLSKSHFKPVNDDFVEHLIDDAIDLFGKVQKHYGN